MLVYMESGAIPGMLQKLKAAYQLDYFMLGVLGSLVYISLSIGCPVFGHLLRRYNAKVVLGTALAVNNAAMLLFALCPTSLPNLFVFIRCVVGFSQAALVVYSPVWIDEYAPAGRHASWMAYLQASTPFGIMLGYLAASVFTFSGHDTILGLSSFRWPFLVQVALVTPLLSAVWSVPSRHVNFATRFQSRHAGGSPAVGASRVTASTWDHELLIPATMTTEEERDRDQAQRWKAGAEGSQIGIASRGYAYVGFSGARLHGVFLDDTAGSEVSVEAGRSTDRGGSGGDARSILDDSLDYATAVCQLLRNGTYVCIVCALTALYFVVTGVQYWGTDYLQTVLHGDPSTVRLLFLFTSATAPVIGVVTGGWFIEKVGGYKGIMQRKRALGWLLVFGVLASAASGPVTLLDNVYGVAALLWALLFFGGMVLPGGSGIFISVIPAELRTIGSSFAAIVFNLFGYFLSPFLSGYLSEEFGSLTLGFRVVLMWSAFGVVFFAAAYAISLRAAAAEPVPPPGANEEGSVSSSKRVFPVRRAGDRSACGGGTAVSSDFAHDPL